MAATVTFQMAFGAPGSFSVFASSSGVDNGGIAAYSIELEGAILSLNHKSLRALVENSQGEVNSAGFTLLRTPDVTVAPPAGSILTISGSQDTITPTPHIIYGFGQTPGNFSWIGLTPVGSFEGDPWSAPLLIAEGSYDVGAGPAGLPRIREFGRLTLANVFTAPGSMSVIMARVVVPEPTSALLCFGCMSALVMRSRRTTQSSYPD
jgi:hypothetical protein